MTLKRFVVGIAAVTSLLAARAWAQDAADWPPMTLPHGVQTQTMGDALRLNGTPTRIIRFTSTQRYEDVLAYFRAQLGSRRVDQAMGGDRLLARREGDFFRTIRLRAAGDGTIGVLSVANLREGSRARERPLGWALPAESAVLSDIESMDGAKRARQLVIVNDAGVEANAAHFERLLTEKGMQLQRRDTGPRHQTLWFAGNGREALLVASRDGPATSIVLTTVSNP